MFREEKETYIADVFSEEDVTPVLEYVLKKMESASGIIDDSTPEISSSLSKELTERVLNITGDILNNEEYLLDALQARALGIKIDSMADFNDLFKDDGSVKQVVQSQLDMGRLEGLDSKVTKNSIIAGSVLSLIANRLYEEALGFAGEQRLFLDMAASAKPEDSPVELVSPTVKSVADMFFGGSSQIHGALFGVVEKMCEGEVVFDDILEDLGCLQYLEDTLQSNFSPDVISVLLAEPKNALLDYTNSIKEEKQIDCEEIKEDMFTTFFLASDGYHYGDKYAEFSKFANDLKRSVASYVDQGEEKFKARVLGKFKKSPDAEKFILLMSLRKVAEEARYGIDHIGRDPREIVWDKFVVLCRDELGIANPLEKLKAHRAKGSTLFRKAPPKSFTQLQELFGHDFIERKLEEERQAQHLSPSSNTLK